MKIFNSFAIIIKKLEIAIYLMTMNFIIIRNINKKVNIKVTAENEIDIKFKMDILKILITMFFF